MSSVTVDQVYDSEAGADEIVRLSGELPGHADSENIRNENPGESSEPLTADKRSPARKLPKNNAPLYASAGAMALLVAVGFVYLHPLKSRHAAHATQASTALPAALPPAAVAPLAPSASLANVALPNLPPAVVQKRYVPEPAPNELSELDGLRTLPQLANSSAVLGQGTLGNETGAPPKPQIQPSSGSHPSLGIGAHHPGQSAVGGPLATQTPVPGHAPPSPPLSTSPGSPSTHPVATATGAKPTSSTNTSVQLSAMVGSAATIPAVAHVPSAPGAGQPPAITGALSLAQQTQLLQLITQVATLERDDRIKEAILSADVQQLSGVVSGTLADYDRRLSLLEAQTAVSGASLAGSNTGVAAAMSGTTPAALPVAGRAATAPSTPPAPVAAIQSTPQPAGPATPVQYHVQAASPGLAMLSVVGGDGSPVEVQVGDTIPGYGKVLAVVQQGDSWVVQTQSGNID